MSLHRFLPLCCCRVETPDHLGTLIDALLDALHRSIADRCELRGPLCVFLKRRGASLLNRFQQRCGLLEPVLRESLLVATVARSSHPRLRTLLLRFKDQGAALRLPHMTQQGLERNFHVGLCSRPLVVCTSSFLAPLGHSSFVHLEVGLRSSGLFGSGGHVLTQLLHQGSHRCMVLGGGMRCRRCFPRDTPTDLNLLRRCRKSVFELSPCRQAGTPICRLLHGEGNTRVHSGALIHGIRDH
mmetsp:Transcript_48144/g.127479  ORF Transcript_48144/g.127479 Transcript_48144/m.127479 type:complete len:241 (-) Transcript_48144:478-1200(-)